MSQASPDPSGALNKHGSWVAGPPLGSGDTLPVAVHFRAAGKVGSLTCYRGALLAGEHRDRDA